VLKGVSFPIYPRRITVIIGASGSGKSVIIKHIMGLFKPDRGQILVFGQDIVPMKDRELNEMRKHFGLLFQGAALLDWLSVYENVAFPVRERGGNLPRGELRDRVNDILERLNLTDIMHRMPGEISAGQRKRVGLARAIVMKPDIMIYDEPTTGQDPLRTRDIDDMIQQTQERFDITSIVISHDMASTFRIGHMITMLYQGRIVAFGSPAESAPRPPPTSSASSTRAASTSMDTRAEACGRVRKGGLEPHRCKPRSSTSALRSPEETDDLKSVP